MPIEFLPFLGLKGSAANGTDTLVMSRGTELFTVSDGDSVLNLEGHWIEAEFNIFGMGNSTQVNFNKGSTIVVRTTIDDGTTNPPTCFSDSRTGETNNLSLLVLAVLTVDHRHRSCSRRAMSLALRRCATQSPISRAFKRQFNMFSKNLSADDATARWCQ